MPIHSEYGQEAKSHIDALKEHLGHKIKCVTYGNQRNITIECEYCSLVLYDYDLDGDF